MGKPLILGRRTFESLPQPLPAGASVDADLGFPVTASSSRMTRGALDLARHAAEAMLTKEIIVGADGDFCLYFLDPADRTHRIAL